MLRLNCLLNKGSIIWTKKKIFGIREGNEIFSREIGLLLK